MAKSRQKGRNSKMEDLDVNREDLTGQFLTTDQGLREPTRKGRKPSGPEGVVIGRDADVSGVAGTFVRAVAHHRHWGRERHE